MSWRQAARAVKLEPQKEHPRIRQFERSVLPTARTQRATFDCQLCPHCSRPLIESVMPQHIKQCLQRKAKNAEAKPEVKPEVKPDVKPEVKAEVEPRKRKAEKKEEEGKKRTKTKQPKQPKQPKTKQPKATKEKQSQVYNPDKNCGVPLPNGQPCMRSLTCKQHPMGAKRAVAGRSMQYDVLLSNYHRQHQMKQAQQSAQAANAAQVEFDELQETQTQENPEREVQQVLDGISHVYCPPLATGEVCRTSFRAQNFRLREMLSMSLMPKKLAATGELMYGRSLAFRPGFPTEFSYVRSQAVQQAYYLQLQQQRAQQLKRQQLQQQQQPQQQQQQQHQPHPQKPMLKTHMEKDPHPEQSARLLAQQRIRAAKDP